MLGEREQTTYAHALESALAVLGPTHTDDAVRRLVRVLRLTDEQARIVVAHGVAVGILDAEGGALWSAAARRKRTRAG